MFGGWRGEILTTIYKLDKTEGRIHSIDFLNTSMDNELLTTIKQEEKENKTRILKSWCDTNKQIIKLNTRIIALATIDIINRKDKSKNPLIYQALDKLINDYQKYKDNFPQDYYVEFGRYMVESGIQGKTGILYVKILESLIDCCKLIGKSKIFGDEKYLNSGIAIFHLYENYVPKFEGDENGLDKVQHFVYSALVAFSSNAAVATAASIGNEIVDHILLKAKKFLNEKLGVEFDDYGTGFDKGDIEANKKGIEYGINLITRYRTFQ